MAVDKNPGSGKAPRSQIIGRLLATAFCAVQLSEPVFASVVRDDNSSIYKQTSVPLYVWHTNDETLQPKYVLIAVHGAAQHGGVFDVLARRLVEKDFLVIAPDVRGAGRWRDLHEPEEPANFELFHTVTDVQNILAVVRREYPNAKIFLLGESIGAGVVLKAVSRSPSHVKGLILCSAGVKPHMHNPMKMKSDFIKGLAHLVQPVSTTDYLGMYSSDDPRIAHEMTSDPLGTTKETGLDMLGTLTFLKQEPSFAAELPKSIPVLMVQGAEDQIVEPESANRILEALPTHDKRLDMVESGHVLAGTSFLKPSVWTAIDDWLGLHEGKVKASSRETKVAKSKNKGAAPTKTPSTPSTAIHQNPSPSEEKKESEPPLEPAINATPDSKPVGPMPQPSSDATIKPYDADSDQGETLRIDRSNLSK